MFRIKIVKHNSQEIIDQFDGNFNPYPGQPYLKAITDIDGNVTEYQKFIVIRPVLITYCGELLMIN